LPCPSIIESEILRMATQFAGKTAEPSNRIYADLDINGSDVIEFVEAVETRYGVDLEWICPRDPTGQFHDATLLEITDYIGSRVSDRT
jgi:hypothetical protein